MLQRRVCSQFFLVLSRPRQREGCPSAVLPGRYDKSPQLSRDALQAAFSHATVGDVVEVRAGTAVFRVCLRAGEAGVMGFRPFYGVRVLVFIFSLH